MKEKGILIERLESIQRDVGLILADVHNADAQPVFSPEKIRELESAQHGMECVLKDLGELREALKTSLAAYSKYRQPILEAA